jgi:alkanesulfonate monooxygenase SsuD/methylene tetrahydromethanopterin reductase-like flavin-dependent oxidoreductase (luciferase family)
LINEREQYGLPVAFDADGKNGGVCVGDPATVDEWINQYFRNYAPEGYDTRITSDKTVAGVRTVRVFRGSTCD